MASILLYRGYSEEDDGSKDTISHYIAWITYIAGFYSGFEMALSLLQRLYRTNI